MTFACLPSITATQEFVVPRSIPIAFATAQSPYAIVSIASFRQHCELWGARA
jgi:hypothetical protein